MLIALLTSAILVMLTVLVHYEILLRISLLLPKIRIPHRLRVMVAVIGATIAHVIEIWIFGLGYYLLIKNEWLGNLTGNFNGSLLDCGYHSFVTYTSLGYGDIIPTNYLRFVTGIEALTGLVLIAWTASFVYVEMRRFWDD